MPSTGERKREGEIERERERERERGSHRQMVYKQEKGN